MSRSQHPFENRHEAESLRTKARYFAETGQSTQAHAFYSRLLASSPVDHEALNYLAVHARAEGDVRTACVLLQRAVEAHPSDVVAWRNLGICLLEAGDVTRSVAAWDQAIQLEPSHATSHLQRAHALEREGRHRDAAITYLRAIAEARRTGMWVSDATTPPGLRPLVQHAVNKVRGANRQLLASLMDPLIARYGREAMRRVAAMASNYVGDVKIRPADSRQRPTFLYFPGLPETPFLPRHLFDWYASLEEAAPSIAAEALDLLQRNARFEPFLGERSGATGTSYLAGRGTQVPRWDAHFFWRHGVRYERNCAAAPLTARQLDRLPLGRVPDHGPECLFSVLGPGSEIQPHTGVTNTRIVTHLPLIVPEHCALRVAGTVHTWQPGRCVSFDDTFEHEAWNRSAETRVVLLFDTWNPHLDEAERDAVARIVVAISGFNREAWETPFDGIHSEHT